MSEVMQFLGKSPSPSWLARVLFYVTPKKSSERYLAIQHGDIVQGLNARMSKDAAEWGKDQLSIEAMRIIPPEHPVGRGLGYCDIVTLMLTRAEGKINELEAIIHRMKCHEAHLDGIIARQDQELKKLRRGGNHPKPQP